jgi:hypothetical protein
MRNFSLNAQDVHNANDGEMLILYEKQPGIV